MPLLSNVDILGYPFMIDNESLTVDGKKLIWYYIGYEKKMEYFYFGSFPLYDFTEHDYFTRIEWDNME